MQLGMIGLGRMGASMVRRLLRDGRARVVHGVPPSAVATLVKDGAAGAASLKQSEHDAETTPLRDPERYRANRVLSAMRYEFGGMVEKLAP